MRSTEPRTTSPGRPTRPGCACGPGSRSLPATHRPASPRSVESAGGPRIDWLEYPLVAGIGSLGADPGRTELVHPFATGYRIVDPLLHLGTNDRFGYYPDAYGGSALQQLSYLERETGGFHLQVEDPTGEAKRLELWKDGATGWLELTIRRYNPDARAGAGLAPAGAVVLFASRSGTWEEGADRYRDWALAQPWASKGPRRDWPENERARWLLEQVGVATFGISVRRDMTAWFRGLQDFLGVPLLHVSGFWWPGGTFASEWYGGYNDWSDSRIDPANLQAIREQGDRVALFLFPQHFARGASEYGNPAPSPASDPVAPWAPYAMNPDPEQGDWSFICPATTAWQAFYGWRAVQLMNLYLPDAEYLDIGPGLGRVRCDDTAHGHPPGWGVALVAGTQAMLDSRRGELHARKGAFVPRGTELVSELYLDRFDFYQARAEAGPLTMLEGDKFREAVKAGWAEKIPLFEFVFHDYGPVRLDGNLKLASELGGTFFWVAATVALEGGLPELNYELSALERLPGMSGRTWFETYRNAFDCGDTTPYAAEAGRATFLRELTDLRTRRGPEFLAYGRMRRTPLLTPAPATLTMNYRLYNTFNRAFTCDLGVEAGPRVLPDRDLHDAGRGELGLQRAGCGAAGRPTAPADRVGRDRAGGGGQRAAPGRGRTRSVAPGRSNAQLPRHAAAAGRRRGPGGEAGRRDGDRVDRRARSAAVAARPRVVRGGGLPLPGLSRGLAASAAGGRFVPGGGDRPRVRRHRRGRRWPDLVLPRRRRRWLAGRLAAPPARRGRRAELVGAGLRTGPIDGSRVAGRHGGRPLQRSRGWNQGQPAGKGPLPAYGPNEPAPPQPASRPRTSHCQPSPAAAGASSSNAVSVRPVPRQAP